MSEIRPAAPNTGRVRPASTSEEAQKQIDASPSKSITSVDSDPAVKHAAKPVEQQPFKSVTRRLSEKDIMNQLFEIQRAPSQDNKQLLSTMIQHGIPATAEAFDDIQTLIKGKKRNADMRSAVVSYAKGLGTSTDGMEILSQYFANQTNIADNLKKLQSGVKQFQASLSAKQQLFDSGLFAGVMGIIGELDDSLKKLTKKQEGNAVIKELKRGKLIHEYKLIGDFLSGVESKIKQGSAKDMIQIKHEFKGFKETLNGVLKALTSQSILSRDMMTQNDVDAAYYYHQFPNPMAPTEQSMDLLIKKDKKSAQGKVDIENTQIIIRFETPDLGEVSVIIDLKKNKVSYKFQTDNGNTKQLVAEMTSELRDQMSELNYELVGVQTLQKKIDIKQLLIPVLNLDKMTRIITEA